MKIEMEFHVRRHTGNFHPRWRIARDAGRLSRKRERCTGWKKAFDLTCHSFPLHPSAPDLHRWPIAIALALFVQSSAVCLAQPTGSPATAVPAQQASASLGHAAAKGLTLKVINGLAAMAVFTAGTGSVVAGGVLSGAVAVSSFTVFVINDYLWDKYLPNTNLGANNESFSPFWSLSRNTAKFLTFKPAVVTADWTVIYLFTGSWASTLTLGPAYSILSPLTFYANNVAWDWYDWYSSAAGPAQPAR
jgi:uncharacterized membrane protein